MAPKRVIKVKTKSSSSSVVRSKISVQEVNRLVTDKVSESVNQCYGVSPVFVVGVEPGSSSGEFVLKLKDGNSVFCAIVTLDNEEGTAQLRAKAWGFVMGQLTGTNVETFETADEAGKITILESIDAEVPYDCTIKITSWGGRFEAKVVSLIG